MVVSLLKGVQGSIQIPYNESVSINPSSCTNTRIPTERDSVMFICESITRQSSPLSKQSHFYISCSSVGTLACGTGECISELYLCDDIKDCFDGTDEICYCYDEIVGIRLQKPFCCLQIVSPTQCTLFHFRGQITGTAIITRS